MDSTGTFVVENVRLKIVELVEFTETLKDILFGTNIFIVRYKNISCLCINNYLVVQCSHKSATGTGKKF